MPHVHRLRVRWAECDVQGVVFYPRYLEYVNDAIDVWMQERLGADFFERFQYQSRKATIEWSAPARLQDVVEVRTEVTRWGRSSFDVAASIAVGELRVAHAALALVSVVPGGGGATAVPDDVRAALSL